MSTAPLWWLLVVWPLLGAAILAIGSTRIIGREPVLTVSAAGCAAVLALVWWMPTDWSVRSACLLGAVALFWRAYGMEQPQPRLDTLAGFVSAAALGAIGPVAGPIAGLAGAAGCLAVQALCIASEALSGQGRVRPVWDAVLIDLAGVVLLLVGDAVQGRPLGAVSSAVGLLMLAGIAGGGRGFCRALLSAGAILVLARHPVALPLVLLVGGTCVWLAPRGSSTVIVALGCMAAVLPHGQGPAVLAAALVVTATIQPAGLLALPWPGFVLAAWVIAACIQVPDLGVGLAFLLGVGVARAAMREEPSMRLPALGWASLFWLGCMVAACLVWPI